MHAPPIIHQSRAADGSTLMRVPQNQSCPAEAEDSSEAPNKYGCNDKKNHWGWKPWSDSILQPESATTQFALCGLDDLKMWTSGCRAGDSLPIDLAPGNVCNAVAAVRRNFESEAIISSSRVRGECRLVAARQRLLWACAFHPRLLSETCTSWLPFDVLELVGASISTEVESLFRVSTRHQQPSIQLLGQTFIFLSSQMGNDTKHRRSSVSQADMICARRGKVGLTVNPHLHGWHSSVHSHLAWPCYLMEH
jgi:hypothetical protein